MNSYGDHNSARGRAQLPGFDGDHGPHGDVYRRSGAEPPAGRAQVGRAQAGRAEVGRAEVGRAQVGRAQVGRAGIPRPDGPGSPGGYDRPAGRASVGRAAVGSASVGGAGAVSGRATVARAAVRPGSGGGSGPGGPSGPGRRASRSKDDPEARRRAKRRKRINWLIASFAVFIMLSGAGVVGGTYYATTVPLPKDLPLPLASTVYYANGKTQLAKLGEFNRSFVKIDQIPEHVQHAVAAAEDRNFYEHSGVDYVGIARAAWNNLTGGSKQGASTITQQYAKNAMDLQGGYARKVKEAILASKLNDEYSKPEIMERYLNTIYFGRGAYGIEAAAQTYFKKSVDKLDEAEGAVLAAIIKQPVATAAHKGYDPGVNPEVAKDRWNYVLGGMVEEGWLTKEKRDELAYPEKTLQPLPKDGHCYVGCGVATPAGNVVNYIKAEFVEMKLCEDVDSCGEEIKKKGYRITTTLDHRLQKAAE
ncbi:MAG TPA: transglycosylase domain-containing protein, partial [Micromonospora sp.]|nr:transglycosylase domain-containing protein [Micromonospora sp.]